MQPDSSGELLRRVIADLQRQAHWAEIITYLEEHSPALQEKKQRSPATFAKNKRWLLNTERLTIAQVLVLRALSKDEERQSMSQGEFIRLLGGNPHRDGLSREEKKEIQLMNQYWANQIRNNIRPLLADYFGLMDINWEDGNKPGKGEYSIRAADLLVDFFKHRLYS